MKQILNLTREKNKDAGLVLLLCLLLVYLQTHNLVLIWISVVCIVITILLPVLFYPFSVIWYGVSEIMGAIVSRIVLCAVFFFIITPVGLVRRLITKKQLLSEQWKKSRESVFADRNIQFSRSDIQNPY
jgi:hypothetical protein